MADAGPDSHHDPADSGPPGDALVRILAEAPAIIWVLRGPSLIIEFASDVARVSVGGREPLVGVPLRDALPEIEGQGIIASIEEVMRSGSRLAHPGRPVRVPTAEGGIAERYYSFTVQRLSLEGGEPRVIVHAVDVSDLVEARQASDRGHDRLTRIERLARLFGAAHEPSEVAAIVVEAVRGAMGADTGVLVRLGPDGWFDLLGASGYAAGTLAPWRRFPITTSAPVTDALATGELVVIETREELEERYPFVRETADIRDSAVIAAPLQVDGHDLGSLLFGFATSRPISPGDRTFVSAVAAHCAVALQRANLHTARGAVAEREKLLAQVSHQLDAPLGVEERLEHLVALVVPRLADLATVRLARPNGGSRLVAVAHSDPAVQELARRVYGSPQAEEHPIGPNHVIATGRAELVLAVTPETRAAWACDRELLADLEALDMRSYLSVPLSARGRTLGALTLQNGSGRMPFDEDDVPTLTEMARRAGLALDNARLFEAQRDAALAFQQRLLPERLPALERAELAVRYRPAASGRSGGDFYDAVRLPDGSASLIVGDVVGHGVDAAAAMGQLRSGWRALALRGEGPATLVRRLSLFAEDVPGAEVTTAVCASVAMDGRLRFACAGHPPPLLLTGDGVATYLAGGRGVPLACGVNRQEEAEATLDPGATLVLYTDGMIERRGQAIDEGLAILRDLMTGRGDDGLDDLLDAAMNHVGTETEDDCAMLACRYGHAPGASPPPS